MLPAGPLMIEHRLIERMIAVMDRHRNDIENGTSPDNALLDAIVDFLRTYADRCHHGKEEDLLFTALKSKPMTPDMVMAMDRLIDDHARSRALVRRLGESNARSRGGDASATGDITEAIAGLVSIYPDHIRREDKEFFPAAMKYLTKEESDVMLSEFREFDRKLIHEKYVAVVEGAEKR
ncbi:MAG: hemerythrin domain-containing protein [Methanomassiliicoccus sp.]|nr:hemerythrin domain-containing protein [Methanomassiliicoccus sp.]